MDTIEQMRTTGITMARAIREQDRTERLAAHQARYELERAAAYQRDPRCVECDARITEPLDATYLQDTGRFACRGACTVTQLRLMWDRLTDGGAHMPAREVTP